VTIVPLPSAPDLDAGFLSLTEKISRERGFGCSSYKEKCLRRRIAVRMRARGVHTYEDYARVLDADEREYAQLLDALTINVTKLFRNWETWEVLAQRVIPELWARPDAALRVWSAGCSSGREAYSLAVLFHRYAESKGAAGRSGRVDVLGSDVDERILQAAVRAEFEPGDFADTPPELRERYFAPERPFALNTDARRLVRFERRDLLREAPPDGPFHLILCRNVLIYFDRASQERLFATFHSALAPGGILVLGKVETLLGDARSLFTTVDARERIFRRA
jgi:chemotaxis protein methyltransferase CheR